MAKIDQLVKKNREQLIKEASHRGMNPYSSPYGSYSDKELIARIVEHDAYYTGRQDERDKREDRHAHSVEHFRTPAQSDEKPPRTLYRVSGDDGENLYVRITKEQLNFLDWLLDNDVINTDYWEFTNQKDIKVEEP